MSDLRQTRQRLGQYLNRWRQTFGAASVVYAISAPDSPNEYLVFGMCDGVRHPACMYHFFNPAGRECGDDIRFTHNSRAGDWNHTRPPTTNLSEKQKVKHIVEHGFIERENINSTIRIRFSEERFRRTALVFINFPEVGQCERWRGKSELAGLRTDMRSFLGEIHSCLQENLTKTLPQLFRLLGFVEKMARSEVTDRSTRNQLLQEFLLECMNACGMDMRRDIGLMGVVEGDLMSMKMAAEHNFPKAQATLANTPLDVPPGTRIGASQLAARSGRPLFLQDVNTYPDVFLPTDPAVRCCLALPMIANRNVVGGISLEVMEEAPETFMDPQMVRVLCVAASQAATSLFALETAQSHTMGRVLGCIKHEIVQWPLRTILNAADCLSAATNDAAIAERQFRRIRLMTHYLQHATDDLSALARLQDDRSPPTPASQEGADSWSLRSVIAVAAEIAQGYATSEEQPADAEVAPVSNDVDPSIAVLVDGDQMLLALVNLLCNPKKYCLESDLYAKVRVTATSDTARHVVAVTIRDGARPIRDELLPLIGWRPVQPQRDSKGRPLRSMGLGAFIAGEHVRRQGRLAKWIGARHREDKRADGTPAGNIITFEIPVSTKPGKNFDPDS